jgi:phosphotransferase system HPr-like phosphotransfer protein
MEEKTTTVLVELTAEFDKKITLIVADKKYRNEKTTKAKEIVALAELGYNIKTTEK